MTDIRRIVVENRRTIFILVAALAVNAALYALIVYPLAQRVNGQESQAGEATRDMVAARRAFEEARGTISGKREADEELRRFYSEILPLNQSGARRMLYPYVEQLARKSNVTPLRSTWSVDTGRQGTLRKLTMTLSLTGEYTNIRRFIHELETAPEFIILDSVSVLQGTEERGLSVTVMVSTYYRAAENGN